MDLHRVEKAMLVMAVGDGGDDLTDPRGRVSLPTLLLEGNLGLDSNPGQPVIHRPRPLRELMDIC